MKHLVNAPYDLSSPENFVYHDDHVASLLLLLESIGPHGIGGASQVTRRPA